MTEVQETTLPGVGIRHDFVTGEGRQVGVLVYRDGRRDVFIYDEDDPDACRATIALSVEDAQTMTELLGASRVATSVAAVQQHVEGLAIEWVTVDDGSASVGRSIGEGAFRTRTGTSIVAVIRDDGPIPAPGPEFVFAAGDVAVAVGTAEGVVALRALLTGGR